MTGPQQCETDRLALPGYLSLPGFARQGFASRTANTAAALESDDTLEPFKSAAACPVCVAPATEADAVWHIPAPLV